MAAETNAQSETDASARTAAKVLLADLPDRWNHTQSVAAAAMAFAAAASPEHAKELVAGAWLHDIGYSPALVRSGFHPVDGAEHLIAEGASAIVVALVAHHTCSRFEAQERGMLEALGRFPEPPADLADALIYADMTTGPTGETVTVDERIAEILTRYPEEDPVHRAITAAEPELRAAVARVQERLAASDQPM